MNHPTRSIVFLATLCAIICACVVSDPLLVSAAGQGNASSAPAAGAGFFKKIDLLEPLPMGGARSLVVSGRFPLAALNAYMRGIFPWIVGVAAGFSVLMIVVGGIQIIFSQGNQGEMQKGKDRIKETLFGLAILVMSALILNALNAFYYRLGS